MLPEVMEAVTGAVFQSRPATLKGYARYRFKLRVYPGLIRQDNGLVGGVLYVGIDARSMRRLDEFEGPFYKKEAVTVECVAGKKPCEVYVVAEEYRDLLGAVGWSMNSFRMRHLKDYLENIQG